MEDIILFGYNRAMAKFKLNNKITANVLRIYEVRLNGISNYKQMLVGVSCIYAVIS